MMTATPSIDSTKISVESGGCLLGAPRSRRFRKVHLPSRVVSRRAACSESSNPARGIGGGSMEKPIRRNS